MPAADLDYRHIGTLGGSPLDLTNPRARLAICLCLDTSASMKGHPINELNSGVRLFCETVRSKDEVRYAADLAIVTFGHKGVQCLRSFAQLYESPNPPSMSASGMTPMGEAVNLALDMIEERRNQYRAAGIQYYHPWLVLMSDGMPNGDEHEEDRAAQRSRQLCDESRLAVFPIGIGRDADRASLAQFTNQRVPMKLRGLNFADFFEWLGKSAYGTSISKVGEKVPTPPITWGVDGGWGTI